MLNKVLLIGNTTRDIELRYLPSGAAVAKTGLAVSRTWKDKSTQEKKEEVMFIDIAIFGRLAEVANQYLVKGKKTLVEGRLVLEQWMDKDGTKRSKHVLSVENLQFLDPKAGEAGSSVIDTKEMENLKNKKSDITLSADPSIDIFGDEIPF